MPYYNMENLKTNEVRLNQLMKIAEMEKFLEDNPDWKLCIGAPFVGDAIRQGVQKVPADFAKYVLGKVKAANPGAQNVERSVKIPREI